MLNKSQIILLHTIKHGDNGIVLQCYSNDNGRQALYLKVSSKNKIVISNLHRLSILNIVTYSNGSTMPFVKELEPAARFDSIRTNIYKNTIAIFLSELLVKCIRESEANLQLYGFLASSINILEHMHDGFVNFHIHFLVHLCRMMGFMPVDNYSSESVFFDVQTARFCEKMEGGENGFSKSESELLHQILNTSAINSCAIKCNGELRLSFSKKMINYLSHHLGINFEMKSMDVLHEVFSDLK